METRIYTEKSTAKRAARAAGVDPDLVISAEDGFTFPAPEATPIPPEFDDGIPDCLKISAEERKAGWERNPPKTVSKETARAKERTPVTKKSSKIELIAGLLKRPEGCTTADVLAATGWPAVSMPAQAKAAGLTLKKEKDGKITRYRAA